MTPNASRFRQRRELRLTVDMMAEVVQRQASQIEYLESVACAFAWDLAVECERQRSIPGLPTNFEAHAIEETMQQQWRESLKSLGEAS